MTKHPISIRKGTTGSKRASSNPPKLEVIRHECKFCGHHKALRTDHQRKCSRCDRSY